MVPLGRPVAKMAAVPTDRSLQTLTAGDFQPHTGTLFRVSGARYADGSPADIDAELAEVTEHNPDPSGRYRTSFSVVFHGPLQPVLPQGIYHFAHAALGPLELFLVPVGPDEPADPAQAPTAMRYEAVFG
jgi:hypothetical protein